MCRVGELKKPPPVKKAVPFTTTTLRTIVQGLRPNGEQIFEERRSGHGAASSLVTVVTSQPFEVDGGPSFAAGDQVQLKLQHGTDLFISKAASLSDAKDHLSAAPCGARTPKTGRSDRLTCSSRHPCPPGRRTVARNIRAWQLRGAPTPPEGLGLPGDPAHPAKWGFNDYIMEIAPGETSTAATVAHTPQHRLCCSLPSV